MPFTYELIGKGEDVACAAERKKHPRAQSLSKEDVLNIVNRTAELVEKEAGAPKYIGLFAADKNGYVRKGLHQIETDAVDFCTQGHVTVTQMDNTNGVTFSVHIRVQLLKKKKGFAVNLLGVSSDVTKVPENLPLPTLLFDHK
jgi:hypothetical protein